jgi:hypothetical protein
MAARLFHCPHMSIVFILILSFTYVTSIADDDMELLAFSLSRDYFEHVVQMRLYHIQQGEVEFLAFLCLLIA